MDISHSLSTPIEKVITIMWLIEVLWMPLLPHTHDYRPLKFWTKQVLKKRAVIMTHLGATLSLYATRAAWTCVFQSVFTYFKKKD